MFNFNFVFDFSFALFLLFQKFVLFQNNLDKIFFLIFQLRMIMFTRYNFVLVSIEHMTLNTQFNLIIPMQARVAEWSMAPSL